MNKIWFVSKQKVKYNCTHLAALAQYPVALRAELTEVANVEKMAVRYGEPVDFATGEYDFAAIARGLSTYFCLVLARVLI